MIYDIIFEVAKYLQTNDKVNLLQIDKYTWRHANQFITPKEHGDKFIYKEILTAIDNNKKYALHLICKCNKINILKQYWEKLKGTNINDDDYYCVFDNGQYELFILLNNMHFSKMKRINNILVDACRLGLKDVIISILDHDWIDLDYCDGEPLMMANRSEHEETINLMMNLTEWSRDNRKRLHQSFSQDYY